MIDTNLNFDEYVFTFCQKGGRKLLISARVSSYMSFEKKKTVLLKAFVKAQFDCYLFTWMFYNRMTNPKINHIHEGARRKVCNNNISSFEHFLKKDKFF